MRAPCERPRDRCGSQEATAACPRGVEVRERLDFERSARDRLARGPGEQPLRVGADDFSIPARPEARVLEIDQGRQPEAAGGGVAESIGPPVEGARNVRRHEPGTGRGRTPRWEDGAAAAPEGPGPA